MEKVLKDPSLKSVCSVNVLSLMVWVMFSYIAFTSGIPWMLSVIQIAIWGLFVLSLMVLVSSHSKNYKTVEINLLGRVPKWWLYVSSVISVGWLWYISGGTIYLTLLFLASRSILSTNYITLLEYHDKRYTDKQKESIDGNLRTIFKNVWDTRDHPDKKG